MSPDTSKPSRHVIDHVLHTAGDSPRAIASFRAWKPAWVELSGAWPLGIDRAIAGGLAADRPSWAFAAAYQGAIKTLTDPTGDANNDDDKGLTKAVCITEKGPPHPRSIASTLRPVPGGGWRLDGVKSFVSGGAEVERLWVAASTGDTEDGRNALRLVEVSASLPGIRFEARPPLGLLPEIGHARVSFDDVPVAEDEALPGDGYLGGIKPFRSLEDLHVTAAFLAWIVGVGRRHAWDRGLLAEAMSLLASARALALAPPLDPAVHVALGGLLNQSRALMTRADPLFDGTPEALQDAWRRDRAVLEIAAMARDKRLEKAWAHYAAHSDNATLD